MRRALGLTLVTLFAAPAAASARSTVIYGLCGPSICKLDAKSGHQNILRRGTRKNPYE